MFPEKQRPPKLVRFYKDCKMIIAFDSTHKLMGGTTGNTVSIYATKLHNMYKLFQRRRPLLIPLK